MIKSEPRNAQERRALGICRTKYKDYINQKKNERIAKRKRKHEEIIRNNNQSEVCTDFDVCVVFDLNSCLIFY